MKSSLPAPSSEAHRPVSRRTVLATAAATVSAVAVALATPGTAFAAPAKARVVPAAAALGTVPIVVHGRDFTQSNYCWYLPAVTVLRNVSYIIDPMTSTKAAQVPMQGGGSTNPFSLMRLGPNNSQSGVPVLIDGLTLTGTVQPKAAANPTKSGHNYHGLVVYWGRGAQVLNSTFIAAAWGDSNSPPGETFQIMGYRDTDTLIAHVEVDGRTADGTRVGGSPMGFNASTRPVIQDSYLHHSLVSSLTYSTAGPTPSASNATSSPITRRVRIEHNANTKMANGYRFTGINHEHVIGTIKHYLPKIAIDWTEWNASHMFFGSWLPSAQVAIAVDPTEISGGHPNNMGCLTLHIPAVFNGRPNTQRISDVAVWTSSGTRLQPYPITGNASKPLPVDRNTHYVVITA
ncbi:hypothetical protein [Subtercola boreus]|uniref:Secreted protein n=1 Tax=Subtercola boreus TaxID=120213 RepID=A0A3E0WAJ5_9MICO|nr:hypothetical protein [Subtercola boreus]RFA19840.1 hypothetical protein B7R24_10990 [Subtercola boreus]RFA19907.1 hypothetical protein B7R23_10970 [Subtercola boreus]RFA26300.1 hypothetical protein B7R25_11090 [Subtercola boreus]